MKVIRFESSFRDLIQIPATVSQLEHELSTCVFSSEGIADLPEPFSSAESWTLFSEIWPDRVPDTNEIEIHLAIYADHSFETIADGQIDTHTSVGVFSGTLFVRDRAPLSWVRQHSPNGMIYVGLRWVVDRGDLDAEWTRLSNSLMALAPGKHIKCSPTPAH